MGWLFAVALGLHRGSRRVVLTSLVPIAAGHALAVLAVVLAVMAFDRFLDPVALRRAAGLLLIAWAAWHWFYGHQHRVRFGMTTGLLGLAAWSFLMAGAHGAGLMLIPLLAPLGLVGGHAHGHGPHPVPGGPLLGALAATLMHGLAMLLTTGGVAVLVYDWLGVAVLRRGWVNLDLLWTAALVGVGLLLLL